MVKPTIHSVKHMSVSSSSSSNSDSTSSSSLIYNDTEMSLQNRTERKDSKRKKIL